MIRQDFDFQSLIRDAGGILPAETYQALYETVRGAPAGDVVEVGTARGAASIAMARALKDAGRADKVQTIGRLRDPARKQVLLDRFRDFDVASHIAFHPGAVEEAAGDLPAPLRISTLLLNADGAIDRDFKLFYNEVLPGAPVVIGGFAREVDVTREGAALHIDQKRKLTVLLVSYFIEQGLIQRTGVIGDTWFGRKPQGMTDPVDFTPMNFVPIYRQLTAATAMLSGPEGPGEAWMRRWPFLSPLLARLCTALPSRKKDHE